MPTISLRKYPEMIPTYERNIPNLRNTLNKTNSDVLVEVDEYDYYISHKVEPTTSNLMPQPEQPTKEENKKLVTVKPEALIARGLDKKEQSELSNKPATIHLQAIVLPKKENNPKDSEQSDIALELPKQEQIEAQKQTENQLSKMELLAESLGMGIDTIKKAKYLIENKCFLPYIAKACGCSVRSIAIVQKEL